MSSSASPPSPGRNYRIEYKDDLPAATWSVLAASVAGTGQNSHRPGSRVRRVCRGGFIGRWSYKDRPRLTLSNLSVASWSVSPLNCMRMHFFSYLKLAIVLLAVLFGFGVAPVIAGSPCCDHRDTRYQSRRAVLPWLANARATRKWSACRRLLGWTRGAHLSLWPCRFARLERPRRHLELAPHHSRQRHG